MKLVNVYNYCFGNYEFDQLTTFFTFKYFLFQLIRDTFWVAAHDRSGAVEAAVAESPGFSESEFEIKQDTDVLDTWFSSALHPFASLGWPKETEDMKK